MKQIPTMVKEAQKKCPEYNFSVSRIESRTNNQKRGMVFVNSANMKGGYKIKVTKFTGQTKIIHGITMNVTETVFEANTIRQTGVRQRFQEWIESQ